jgi:uracil-DNA glycosylase family 4
MDLQFPMQGTRRKRVKVIRTVSQTPGCDGCPMQSLYPTNNFVSPQCPNPARDLNRLVIAEAPGKQESEKGQPLVGPAGQVFDSLLERAGIPRDGLTIINCINCRPHKNVFPTDSKARKCISKEDAQIAVNHCLKHHVDPIIRRRHWDRVYLLGVKSVRLVGKIRQGRMSELRGRSVDIAGMPSVGMPLYHPSYLMQWGKSKKRVTVNDLKSGLGQSPQSGNYPGSGECSLKLKPKLRSE